MLKSVLIVSESAYRRTLLRDLLSSHKGIEVKDVARNGNEALNIIKSKNPDVLILDIEYENNEWQAPFNQIIKLFNITTIVLTDLEPENADCNEIPIFLKSYDYIVKPSSIWKDLLPTIRDKLISKVILADIGKINKIDNKIQLLNKKLFIEQSQKTRSTPKVQFNKILEPSIEDRSEKYFLTLLQLLLRNYPQKS